MGAPSTTIACTTLGRVKALLNIASSDTDRDDVLNAVISGCSKRMENWMDRPLGTGTRTEQYDYRPRSTVIYLRAYPVSALTSVKVAKDWMFNTTVAEDTAIFQLDSENGRLYCSELLAAPDTSGLFPDALPLAVQIVYVGGLAADTTALIAAYPDIALAADIYCSAVWKQREKPLATSERIGDSSVSRSDELKMPKVVEDILWPYRRIRFGI